MLDFRDKAIGKAEVLSYFYLKNTQLFTTSLQCVTKVGALPDNRFTHMLHLCIAGSVVYGRSKKIT